MKYCSPLKGNLILLQKLRFYSKKNALIQKITVLEKIALIQKKNTVFEKKTAFHLKKKLLSTLKKTNLFLKNYSSPEKKLLFFRKKTTLRKEKLLLQNLFLLLLKCSLSLNKILFSKNLIFLQKTTLL